MIRGSDGYDYETLADCLLGTEARNSRNSAMKVAIVHGMSRKMAVAWSDCWKGDLHSINHAVTKFLSKNLVESRDVLRFMTREHSKVLRALAKTTPKETLKDADDLPQRQ